MCTMMTWKMLPYFLFRLGFGRGLFTVHDVAAFILDDKRRCIVLRMSG